MIAAACTMVDLGMGYPFAACKLGLALTGLRFAAQQGARSELLLVVKRPARRRRPERHHDVSRRVPGWLLLACFGRLRCTGAPRATADTKEAPAVALTRGPRETSQSTFLTVAFLNASTFDVK